MLNECIYEQSQLLEPFGVVGANLALQQFSFMLKLTKNSIPDNQCQKDKKKSSLIGLQRYVHLNGRRALLQLLKCDIFPIVLSIIDQIRPY